MRGTEQLEKRTESFYEACGMRVTVGTNGYQGGDAGHGSRTYLRIEGDGADMEVTPRSDGPGFTVELGGDAELSTFTQALAFAVATLQQMSGDASDREPRRA